MYGVTATSIRLKSLSSALTQQHQRPKTPSRRVDGDGDAVPLQEHRVMRRRVAADPYLRVALALPDQGHRRGP